MALVEDSQRGNCDFNYIHDMTFCQLSVRVSTVRMLAALAPPLKFTFDPRHSYFPTSSSTRNPPKHYAYSARPLLVKNRLPILRGSITIFSSFSSSLSPFNAAPNARDDTLSITRLTGALLGLV